MQNQAILARPYLEQMSELTAEGLMALANEEIGALAVENFYDTESVTSISSQLIKERNFYINAPSIGRIGMAFFEAEMKKERLDHYYNTAIDGIDYLRKVFHPYLSPIDLIRLKLQEIWVSGANIENLHRKKMFIGLARIVLPGVNFLAHQDDLRVDDPMSLVARGLKAQFALNVYMEVPKDGGELKLWNYELEKEEYNRLREPGSYGIELHRLPSPTCIYQPKKGELVIFNCRRLHAVGASQESERLSISCFVGYRGENTSLTYWS